MLSMIEVQCPHCGAKGQIMVPPVGSIIIGPCPQCQELVVVFCGQVLPLNKAVMTDGTLEDRQEHLLTVLTEFLSERIRTLMTDEPMEELGASDDLGLEEYPSTENGQAVETDAPSTDTSKPNISQTEYDKFIEVDLKLLDNKAYFESIFNQ